MNIIIYSLGVGVFFRILAPPGQFSLTAYMSALVLLSVEPWAQQAMGQEGFIWSRTLIGVALAVPLIAWAGRGLVGAVRRTAWRALRPHGPVGISHRPLGLTALILGAAAGGLVSLIFGGLLETAATPFWPILSDNPLAGVMPESQTQRMAALFWPLSLTLWGLKRMGGRA